MPRSAQQNAPVRGRFELFQTRSKLEALLGELQQFRDF
jgi:hypothetical protein